MTDVDNSLDQILQKELANTSKFSKLLTNKSKIQSTAELSILKQRQRIDIREKTFNPDTIFNSFILLLFLVLFGLTLRIFLTAEHSDRIPLVLLLLLFCLAVLGSIKKFYLDKKLNYRIFLQPKGIMIGKEFYEWPKISNTAILFKGEARGHTEFLVLEIDNSYEKFDLSNFDLFGLKKFPVNFANYIEYFKNK